MAPSDLPADLAERIDRSIGPGPDSSIDVDLLMTRGRRRRARRRAVGVAVVAAVVATGVVLVQPMSSDRVRGSDVVATSPSASATPSASASPSASAAEPSTAAERRALQRLADRAVTFGGDGRVTLRPDTSVVWSLSDPYRVASPGWSRGLAVEFRGHRFWYAMSGPGDGSVAGSTRYYVGPQERRAAFERFVADQDPAGAATAESVSGR